MTSALPESSEPLETTPEKRWWLAIRGVAEGPYTAGYITVSLRTRSLAPDTPACLVGTQEWKAITNWETFGLSPSPLPPPVPPPLANSTPNDNPFINPALPSMANWLWVYCVIWRPVVSIFALLNWPYSPAIVVLAPSTSLLATAAFVTGGVLLRKRRKSGVTIIQVTLWIALAVTVLFVLGALLSIANAGSPEKSGVPSQSGAPTQSGAGPLMILLWLLELGFQVPAVVWLHRHGSSLPNFKD
jgi:hypothetical protein